MVNLINASVGGGQAALGGLTQKSAEVALPIRSAPQAAAPVPASVPNEQVADLLQKRTAAFRDAISQSLPKFFFPVSDVRFTIYKNDGGQFVTQVTNIISGETTNISEPEILQGANIGRSGFVQTSA